MFPAPPRADAHPRDGVHTNRGICVLLSSKPDRRAHAQQPQTRGRAHERDDRNRKGWRRRRHGPLKALGPFPDFLVADRLAGNNGRDHNPHGFTMWMAGGGVKGGYAYGATDDYGYYAAENKMHVHDLHATILHLMGLDHQRLTYRYAGRDFRLTDVAGQVADDILA